MKQTFLYLFIFSLLINVFLYVNSDKILKAKEQEITESHQQVKVLKDSIAKQAFAANAFALEANLEAQAEINLQQHEVADLEIKLRDALIKKNDETPNGNPLVTYPPINGDKSVITKIKVLNHRWIIADFYAGQAKGEVLLKYFINDDKSFDFELVNSVLYQL